MNCGDHYLRNPSGSAIAISCSPMPLGRGAAQPTRPTSIKRASSHLHPNPFFNTLLQKHVQFCFFEPLGIHSINLHNLGKGAWESMPSLPIIYKPPSFIIITKISNLPPSYPRPPRCVGRAAVRLELEPAQALLPILPVEPLVHVDVEILTRHGGGGTESIIRPHPRW